MRAAVSKIGDADKSHGTRLEKANFDRLAVAIDRQFIIKRRGSKYVAPRGIRSDS